MVSRWTGAMSFDSALPDVMDMVDTTVPAYMEMSMGSLDAEEEDVATALSMPIFMLSDTAESMKK